MTEDNDTNKLLRDIKLKDIASRLSEELPMLILSFEWQAKCHKVKYDALIKEGFTAGEALELCKVIS